MPKSIEKNNVLILGEQNIQTQTQRSIFTGSLGKK